MVTLSLNGRRTLVIGGARGIGAAVVRMAASCGSDVAWTHLDTERGRSAAEALAGELSTAGVRVFHRAVDCTVEDDSRQFFQELESTWGGLEHLVYNAGYTSPVPFEDIDLASWRRVVDINLNGAFLALKLALPMLKKAANASIVLIGSAAIVAGGGGRADYASAKAGLEGLNRAVTKEFAPLGIRCNLVHPSLIETDLLKQRHPDAEKRKQLAAEVPLRRLGQPEDIASAVIFLLSDLASYITAQSIYIDGGRTFCK
ncbi:MAG TPA: SDR family NAD(P)-dependent oxidoreductase [Lentisphaeria bacterium]|nr:SDR family NAD(P)-dependent oxidoreductase [Lentisphaeria bacterium]